MHSSEGLMLLYFILNMLQHCFKTSTVSSPVMFLKQLWEYDSQLFGLCFMIDRLLLCFPSLRFPTWHSLIDWRVPSAAWSPSGRSSSLSCRHPSPRTSWLQQGGRSLCDGTSTRCRNCPPRPDPETRSVPLATKHRKRRNLYKPTEGKYGHFKNKITMFTILTFFSKFWLSEVWEKSNSFFFCLLEWPYSSSVPLTHVISNILTNILNNFDLTITWIHSF